MSKTLHLKVVTPERTLFEEDVLEVSLPTSTGHIAILPNHAKLVTKIEHGDIIVKNDKGSRIAAIYGGIGMVEEEGNVTILADSADHIHEIDEKEVEDAIKKARDYTERFALEEAGLAKSIGRDSHMVLAETQSELLKNLTRLKVIRKHRTHNIKYDK